MSLTLTDVERIEHLARLKLSEADALRMRDQLNQFFTLVEKMQAVNTEGIAPLAHPIEAIQDIVLRLRDDAVTESIDRESNQRSAPATENGLYLVPQVLE